MGSFSTQYVSDEFKSRLPRGNKLAHISARSRDRNCSKNMKYRHTGLPKNLNIKKNWKSMSEQRAYFVNINIA